MILEKLSEEEIRFLIDNRAAHWMNLVRKVGRIVNQNFDVEFKASKDHEHGFLAYCQGKFAGIDAVINFLEFYSQEMKKEEAKRPPHLVPK